MNSKAILYLAIGMSALGFVVLATTHKSGATSVISIENNEVTETSHKSGSNELITGSMDLSEFDKLEQPRTTSFLGRTGLQGPHCLFENHARCGRTNAGAGDDACGHWG